MLESRAAYGNLGEGFGASGEAPGWISRKNIIQMTFYNCLSLQNLIHGRLTPEQIIADTYYVNEERFFDLLEYDCESEGIEKLYNITYKMAPEDWMPKLVNIDIDNIEIDYSEIESNSYDRDSIPIEVKVSCDLSRINEFIEKHSQEQNMV